MRICEERLQGDELDCDWRTSQKDRLGLTGIGSSELELRAGRDGASVGAKVIVDDIVVRFAMRSCSFN